MFSFPQRRIHVRFIDFIIIVGMEFKFVPFFLLCENCFFLSFLYIQTKLVLKICGLIHHRLTHIHTYVHFKENTRIFRFNVFRRIYWLERLEEALGWVTVFSFSFKLPPKQTISALSTCICSLYFLHFNSFEIFFLLRISNFRIFLLTIDYLPEILSQIISHCFEKRD